MHLPGRSKRERKLCKRCGDHPALYRYKGRVRFARDHDLCPRCWRSISDSQMSSKVAPKRMTIRPPGPRLRRGTDYWRGARPRLGADD